MGWLIQCTANCGNKTWVRNIVDLIQHHRDPSGWFVCSCGRPGYIEKKFNLQERDETWEPYLKGIVTLGDPDNSYQPFVFLVSEAPDQPATDVWFSYYKDLTKAGGRLKLGYGPGGPPVLSPDKIKNLLKHLLSMGCFRIEDLHDIVKGHS